MNPAESTAAPPPARLAILVSYSGDGGVERVINLLAGECARHGPVDLLTLKRRGRHVAGIPAGVRQIELGSRSAWRADAEIAAYLDRERPAVLLAAKDRAGRAALRAAARAQHSLPVWLQLHSDPRQALAKKGALLRWLRLAPIRRWYPQAAGVIAVSRGLADALAEVARLPRASVHVIRNPVVTPTLFAQAAEAVPHPWLADRPVPVVIGVGRLTRQKDFATLLRAFALARRQRPLRLIVLGEGEQRAGLEALARELGVADDLLLPGFAANPYAWMARADLFALSSAWEGSPTVLTEALALGVPCVSTRCPSGPDELLADGRYGALVPVGDAAALAQAMLATLAAPLPAATLRTAVDAYRVEVAARAYRQRLGLG